MKTCSIFMKFIRIKRSEIFKPSLICSRSISSSPPDILKEKLASLIPVKAKDVSEFTKQYGNKVVEEITIDMIYKGMRDIKSLVTETSHLDANEGIRYRGFTLSELTKLLPSAPNQSSPMAESVFWFLLTGEIPSHEEVEWLRLEWQRRSQLPVYAEEIIRSFPKDLHPMAQFSACVTAMHRDSVFERDYHRGIKRANYWSSVYEDAMNLLARLPRITAMIYNHTYRKDRKLNSKTVVDNPDFTRSFCDLVDLSSDSAVDFMRLYFFAHADHEGGNASAHTCHLVGSTLSDPYLSFGAALNALAGPLHGRANQECVEFINRLLVKDPQPTESTINEYLRETLKSGRVIPGCGHAVLRVTDPRYTLLREFGLKHFPDDLRFKITCQTMDAAPKILTEFGRAKNPWPNVDAVSGSILWHYGFTHANFYTVLFGVSRCLGTMTSLIWDRALQFPLERPKSLPTEMFKALVGANK